MYLAIKMELRKKKYIACILLIPFGWIWNTIVMSVLLSDLYILALHVQFLFSMHTVTYEKEAVWHKCTVPLRDCTDKWLMIERIMSNFHNQCFLEINGKI